MTKEARWPPQAPVRIAYSSRTSLPPPAEALTGTVEGLPPSRILTSPRGDVPEVPLGVPDRILPLAVWLVFRRRFDRGSGALGVTIVSVYIVDEDNETAWLRRQGSGRGQAVFGVDAVEPN